MARAGGKDRRSSPDALAEARAAHPRRAVKVLALDYGAARTGVAVSDATGTIARPLGVVERAGSRATVSRGSGRSSREQDAERIVVGLPLTLRGERGEQARRRSAFVEALRGVVAVPVETYDERFTTGSPQAGGGATRTRAPQPTSSTSYLERAERGAMSRRRATVALGRARSSRGSLAAWLRGSRARRGAAPRSTTTAPSPPRAADHLPGGVHARARWPSAWRRCARSPIEKRARHAAAHAAGYLQATARAVPPAEFRKDWKRRSIEGFLFPATYEFTKQRRRRSSSRDQLAAFRRELAQGRPALCALEEPDAVRRPDHRVDDREGGASRPTSGALVAAVIYNRLHAACRSGSTRRSATG